MIDLNFSYYAPKIAQERFDITDYTVTVEFGKGETLVQTGNYKGKNDLLMIFTDISEIPQHIKTKNTEEVVKKEVVLNFPKTVTSIESIDCIISELQGIKGKIVKEMKEKIMEEGQNV